MPLVEVLGETGQVGEDAALADGGLALGRCLFEPGAVAAMHALHG
jgi:hypothetical protein